MLRSTTSSDRCLSEREPIIDPLLVRFCQLLIEIPLEQARSFDPNLAKVSEWIIKEGFQVDIPALRAIYPDLMTLETYLRKSGWEQAAQ